MVAHVQYDWRYLFTVLCNAQDTYDFDVDGSLIECFFMSWAVMTALLIQSQTSLESLHIPMCKRTFINTKCGKFITRLWETVKHKLL